MQAILIFKSDRGDIRTTRYYIMLSTEQFLDDKRGLVISLSNERDLLTRLSSARIIVLGIFIQKEYISLQANAQTFKFSGKYFVKRFFLSCSVVTLLPAQHEP